MGNNFPTVTQYGGWSEGPRILAFGVHVLYILLFVSPKSPKPLDGRKDKRSWSKQEEIFKKLGASGSRL
jgi:hypothetical protein